MYLSNSEFEINSFEKTSSILSFELGLIKLSKIFSFETRNKKKVFDLRIFPARIESPSEPDRLKPITEVKRSSVELEFKSELF